jgi:hypothetical protein
VSDYLTDQGTRFGTWDDPTSRLIYQDAMPTLLSGVGWDGTTLDLGGGNGLASMWFEDTTTVDNDPAKEPDVVADIRSYVPDRPHDRVLLRYVLHYLDDEDAAGLFRHIASWHTGELVVIQFVNDDLVVKATNSLNEVKWFRTEAQLRSLFGPWRVHRRIAVGYDVHPDFYRNRLGHPDPTGHPETVVAYTLGATP